MSIRRTVLAITKRPAELCATQSLLYGAGLELVTATNLVAAKSVIKGMRITAVIICKDSWSAEERDRIVSDLNESHPQLAVVMRCPGCKGCDEAAHRVGTMLDERPLNRLIAASYLANPTLTAQ